jgi:hypothetical protein
MILLFFYPYYFLYFFIRYCNNCVPVLITKLFFIHKSGWKERDTADLQFDISANALVIRALQSPKSIIVCSVVDSTVAVRYILADKVMKYFWAAFNFNKLYTLQVIIKPELLLIQ